MLGSDSEAVAAAGTFPRSLTSKGWVSPARPVRPAEFPPRHPLPRRSEAPQGKDRREDRPPPASQENPRSSPDAAQIPETPSPGALREGRGLRIQTARRPPRRRVRDLVEKQNRQGKARPELGGDIGKPRPPILGWGIGNPAGTLDLGRAPSPWPTKDIRGLNTKEASHPSL